MPRQWRCGGKRVARGGEFDRGPRPCHHMHSRSVPGLRCHFLFIPFVGRTEIGISIPSRTRGGGKKGKGRTPWGAALRLEVLLEDLDDRAGADGATTFADSEAEALFHGDRLDQVDRHLGGVSWHDHLGALWQ